MKSLTKHIEECINEVRNRESLLSDGYIINLSLSTYPHQMSTVHTQSLLNKICSIENPRYLEIGVLNGASYFAAASNNDGVYYGVDNWSKYGNRQDSIKSSIEKYQNENRKFVFINHDQWTFDLSLIEDKINVFFYDGDHSFEGQSKILNHFDKILDDQIILIVDDYCAEGLRLPEATHQAIQNSNFNLISSWVLDDRIGRDGWWNGLFVGYLEREK